MHKKIIARGLKQREKKFLMRFFAYRSKAKIRRNNFFGVNLFIVGERGNLEVAEMKELSFYSKVLLIWDFFSAAVLLF